MPGPEWLNKKVTTRSRSKKQETKIAIDLKGRTTANSGAVFGENDVTTDFCEIEAKTTKKKSFSLDSGYFRKVEKKTKLGKLPVMVIDYETTGQSLAVLKYDDLKYLIAQANKRD